MSTTSPDSMLDRIAARFTAIPLHRLRRALLALYVLTAFFDATGKALAANPRINAAARRLVSGPSAVELHRAVRPRGNFEIFRTASRHLVTGEDLYAEYPQEHGDRFKYSPTFAFLFAPLAWIPWPVALFLWSAFNALALFTAVEHVLPARSALLATALMYLEVLRGMQNAQSNALVAALIIFTFAALERERSWRAAAAVALGACIKIFPLAALTFAIPRRRALRTGLAAAAIGAALVALPLLIVPPAQLAAQYHSWQGVEHSDATQRWFSVMELVHRWSGTNLPNWPLQLVGVITLLAPLLLRRDRWDEHRFRVTYLCSVLLFVVLFNHQAERASYLIAFTGAAIWFAAEPRTTLRTTLFGTVMLTVPIMSTLVPGAWLRTPTMMTYRLALPCLVLWLLVQRDLLVAPAAELSTPERPSDELGVQLDLHVAFDRG